MEKTQEEKIQRLVKEGWAKAKEEEKTTSLEKVQSPKSTNSQKTIGVEYDTQMTARKQCNIDTFLFFTQP